MFGERMSLATCCPEIEIMQIWDHHGNACKGPGFPSSFVLLACLNQDPSCSQVRAQLSKDCWPLHAGRPGLHLHLVHTSSMTKEELLLQEEVVEIGPSAWVLPSRSICKTHSKAMARFWTIADEVRGGLSSYLSDESFPAKHSLTMIPVTVPNDSDDLEFGGYNLQKVWWFQILNTIQCARTCYLTDLFDKNAQRSCLCKVNLSTNIPINAMLVPPI